MAKEELPEFDSLDEAPTPSDKGVALFYLRVPGKKRVPYVKYPNGETERGQLMRKATLLAVLGQFGHAPLVIPTR